MNCYCADLHVHTNLSACADVSMRPDAIVQEAYARHISILAICDHNAAQNVVEVSHLAGEKLCIIPGIEITTHEHIHVLGWFENCDDALAVALCVQSTLQSQDDAKHSPSESLTHTPFDARKLAGASSLDLCAVVELIRKYRGFVVAAHVDRPRNGLLSVYKDVPRGVHFDAVEVSAAGVAQLHDRGVAGLGIPIVTASDSHSLATLGCPCCVFELEQPCLSEIVLAVHQVGGRRYRIA